MRVQEELECKHAECKFPKCRCPKKEILQEVELPKAEILNNFSEEPEASPPTESLEQIPGKYRKFH